MTYELGDETYIGYTETKEYVSYADMEKALLEMTYQTDMLDEMNDEEDAEPDDSEYTLYTPVEEKEDNHSFLNTSWSLYFAISMRFLSSLKIEI